MLTFDKELVPTEKEIKSGQEEPPEERIVTTPLENGEQRPEISLKEALEKIKEVAAKNPH